MVLMLSMDVLPALTLAAIKNIQEASVTFVLIFPQGTLFVLYERNIKFSNMVSAELQSSYILRWKVTSNFLFIGSCSSKYRNMEIVMEDFYRE